MPERLQSARIPSARQTSGSRLAATSPLSGRDVSPVSPLGTSSGGQSLDKHTSAKMSARFGHDFSKVRIHTDARAEESADALGAHAYAVGNDIVFGAGRYTPGSPQTERLLAHELTHVAQQAQWGGGDWGRASHKGDASEREADALASQVMMGRSVQAQAAPQAAVARDEDETSRLIGPPDPGVCQEPPVSEPLPETQPAPRQVPPAPPLPQAPIIEKPPVINPNDPRVDPPPDTIRDPPSFPLPSRPPAPLPGEPAPATPAVSGGGIVNTIEEFFGAFGSRLTTPLPPVPKWILHPEEDHSNDA